MASVRPLTDLTVADLWREVKDPATLWGDVSQQTLRTVKLLWENRMHDELAYHVHAGRSVRDYGRVGYRNGVYRRRLVDHSHYLFLAAATRRVKTPEGTRRRHALVA